MNIWNLPTSTVLVIFYYSLVTLGAIFGTKPFFEVYGVAIIGHALFAVIFGNTRI